MLMRQPQNAQSICFLAAAGALFRDFHLDPFCRALVFALVVFVFDFNQEPLPEIRKSAFVIGRFQRAFIQPDLCMRRGFDLIASSGIGNRKGLIGGINRGDFSDAGVLSG